MNDRLARVASLADERQDPPERDPPATSTPISVVVIDTVRVSGEAIAAHLRLLADFDVIGVSAPGDKETLHSLETVAPDVTLINSHDEATSLRALRLAAPASKLVAIGVPGDQDAVLSCAELGIDAFMTRDEPLSDLPARLKEALRGEMRMSAQLAASLFRRVGDLSSPTRVTLTRREAQVARLIHVGLSNKEIAKELAIEISTVKNHVHSILGKLRVRTRSAVAASRVGSTEAS